MKKGFTLIELLSVIVVLAIIALITVPVISNVINKARLNALKDSAYGLIDASNLYIAMNDIKENVRFDKNDSENTLKNLKYKGSIKEGTVVINGKGKITICITDGENSAYKNYIENNVTLIKGKTCTIPTNSNIVYLNGDRTLEELSNLELTDIVTQLQEDVTNLKEENTNLKSQISSKTSLEDIYPVGSIYISVNNTNPSTIYGGTWEKIEDKFLLSSGTNTLGSTGGSSSVSYTPTGTVGNTTLTVNQIPSHRHKLVYTGNVGWFIGDNSGLGGSQKLDSVSYGKSYSAGATVSPGGSLSMWATESIGGSQAHTHTFTGTAANISTMPPYLVVNVWKRVS